MSRRILLVNAALLIVNAVHGRNLLNINKDCECGIPNEEIALRIVGGKVISAHIFPWAVAIWNKGRLFCGGILINDRYVLTAGHCIASIYHTRLVLGLGLHDLQDTSDGMIISKFDLIVHENFTSTPEYDINDIGLIRLKNPIAFSHNIRPVCLPAAGSNYTGQEVKIIGWGRIEAKGNRSRYLRHVDLKAISNAECKKTGYGHLLKEFMMCAYEDDKDACQGDSGGPLLYQRKTEKYETIGIVSWGRGCAERGFPGVYVRLTDYLDWIYSHTTDATYCTDN